ncbi:MAG TPA: glycosyltransferase [Terriglobales bacterium]|nr:glycosyltransferase [Terriglobales bacterium]
MRILFAATKYPLPPTNGQAMRTLSLLQGLAELGHEISYVGFAPETAAGTGEPLTSLCRAVELVRRGGGLPNASAGSGIPGRVACVLTGRSYSLSRFRSTPVRGVIARQLRARGFDLLFCDSLYALANVPPTVVPIILNCHNVEHIIFARYARLDASFAKRWYARIEGQAMARAERRACRRAALAMACSEADSALLARLRADLPMTVVPNVVDLDKLAAAAGSPAPSQPPVLLFQGSMDWYPNRDAVEYFADEILPLIRSEYPDVKFLVAGRNPPPALVDRFRALSAVEFTGTVPDMNRYLRAATLAVVPLRLGSGTRIKILEACGAGKAVVSTTVGAEGLALRDGEEILLSDRPADFARCVLTLLRDAALRDAIAAAGRAAVTERYGRPALLANLQAALALLPGRAPGPATVGSVATWR